MTKSQKPKTLADQLIAMLDGNATENQLGELCGDIDAAGAWGTVMEKVIRRRKEFPLNAKLQFRLLWATFGGGIRTAGRDDLKLIKTLRKLMPPYEGNGVMTLYRSETILNRNKHTYGISWSAQPGLAKSMVKEEEPRILLKASVPASAIITFVPGKEDRYRENEFLVDRRYLPANAVAVVRQPKHNTIQFPNS